MAMTDYYSDKASVGYGPIPPQTAKPFNVGDVVFLKSGGPALTVNSLGQQDRLISVEWFSGCQVRRDRFDPECLTTEKIA